MLETEAMMSEDWVRIPVNCDAIDGVIVGCEADELTVERDVNESDALEMTDEGKLMTTLAELLEADDKPDDAVTEALLDKAEPDTLDDNAEPDALEDKAEETTEPDTLLEEVTAEPDDVIELDAPLTVEESTELDPAEEDELTPDGEDEPLEVTPDGEDEPLEVTPDVLTLEGDESVVEADVTPELVTSVGCEATEDAEKIDDMADDSDAMADDTTDDTDEIADEMAEEMAEMGFVGLDATDVVVSLADVGTELAVSLGVELATFVGELD